MSKKTKPEQFLSASEILHQRYIKGDPKRLARIEEEHVNCEIAQLIYDLRTGAGLTQRELAEKVGTTASVICRLEDADYRGHSLAMLTRIGKALNKRLEIRIVDEKKSHRKLKKAG